MSLPPASSSACSPALQLASRASGEGGLMPRSTARPDARTKLLEAALSVIRTKGYSATSVDELCAAAGFTKGAFFLHFKSKDELGGDAEFVLALEVVEK